MGHRVGIALLAVSALLWLLLLLGIASGDDADAGSALLGGIAVTAIPIAIGLYLVRPQRGAAIEPAEAGEMAEAGEVGSTQEAAPTAVTPFARWWLPHPLWLAGALIVVLAAGQASALTDVTLVPGLPLLAASLGPLAALAFAARRLDYAAAPGRLWAALGIGVVLSVPVAIILEGIAPLLILAIVLPLRQTVGDLLRNPSLERFFYSRALVIVLIEAAVVAPLAEEFAKPLGALMFARRLRSTREAFLIGMAGGVAFAIIENLIYLGFVAESWPSLAAVRSIGGVLHPLTAGMLGVAWFDLRRGAEGASRRWFGTFALAVALHAAWNGGITLLLGAFGTYYFGTRTWQLTLFDVGLPAALLALLTLLSLLMWRILWVMTDLLRGRRTETPRPALAGPRPLAAIGLALLAVAVPLGALAAPFVTDYLPHVLRTGT